MKYVLHFLCWMNKHAFIQLIQKMTKLILMYTFNGTRCSNFLLVLPLLIYTCLTLRIENFDDLSKPSRSNNKQRVNKSFFCFQRLTFKKRSLSPFDDYLRTGSGTNLLVDRRLSCALVLPLLPC